MKTIPAQRIFKANEADINPRGQFVLYWMIAYRGAVLGALLGAANGMEGFPERWIKGLRHPPPKFRKNFSP